MSLDAVNGSLPKAERHKHKHKDREHSHKQSKKRKHDRAAEHPHDLALDAQPSPSKKRRHDSAREALDSHKSRKANRKGNTSNSPSSPFALQTTSLYLPLSPISQQKPLQGICAEHLSPLLLTYFAPVDGVVISYSNARLTNHPRNQKDSVDEQVVYARSIDEYAAPYVWITADFLVLRPERDVWIEGYVNLQNESHLGLLCWNLFNASIERRRLPKSWKWVGDGSEHERRKKAKRKDGEHGAVESQGSFEDEHGEKIDGLVRFRVVDFEAMAADAKGEGFLTISGTLLDEKEERKIRAEDQRNAEHKMTHRGKGDAEDDLEGINTDEEAEPYTRSSGSSRAPQYAAPVEM